MVRVTSNGAQQFFRMSAARSVCCEILYLGQFASCRHSRIALQSKISSGMTLIVADVEQVAEDFMLHATGHPGALKKLHRVIHAPDIELLSALVSKGVPHCISDLIARGSREMDRAKGASK